MTKEEKDIIFNRLFELEERHSAFAESVRDNAYCEAIADVKLIIEGIKEPSLPANVDEAAEKIASDIVPKYPDINWDICFEKIVEGVKAGAQWRDAQIPKLSEGLDEAAEKEYYNTIDDLHDVWINAEGEDVSFDQIEDIARQFFELGKKAGAKWMAGQGETIEGTLGYGPHLQRPIIMLEGVPKFYDGHSQEVIVQIRKV